MITCKNCNKQLEDGVHFCDACGTPVAEAVPCPDCENETVAEVVAEQTEVVTEAAEEPVVTAESEQTTEPAQEKKNIGVMLNTLLDTLLEKLPFRVTKKMLALGGAAVALVLVLVISLIALLSGNKPNNIYYLKDKEMYFTGLQKLSAWQITDRLFDTDDISDSEMVSMASQLGWSYVKLSKDGKRLFYFDRIDDDGADLYYRNPNKPKAEPVKIDSDITRYEIDAAGKRVVYIKEGNLYEHNLKEKEKIANDVTGFQMSEDGKIIVYMNSDDNIYFKQSGKEKEKIDGEVYSVETISENCKTVYYIKENALYKKVLGKEKEKLLSDVSDVIKIYDSGDIYYVTEESEDKTLLSYVTDDKKAADAEMAEPVSPQYPYFSDFDTYEEYQAAYEQYERDYEVYQAEKDAYNKKLNRDNLRESLENSTITVSSRKLYFFNGKESKVITEAYDTYEVCGKTPIIIYSAYKRGEVGEIKLSELSYASEVRTMVNEALSASEEMFIAIKDAATAWDYADAQNFSIDKKGTVIYFRDDVSSEKGTGDLYRMTISGNKLGKAEIYDSDVSRGVMLADGKYMYFKDVKESKGELFIDKKKVDDDVYTGSYQYNEDNGSLLYYKDYKDSEGTLMLYKKGKTVQISEDVRSYYVTAKGEIVYLYDYSTKSYTGELFQYNGRKPKKIDTDVTAIIPVS